MLFVDREMVIPRGRGGRDDGSSLGVHRCGLRCFKSMCFCTFVLACKAKRETEVCTVSTSKQLTFC